MPPKSKNQAGLGRAILNKRAKDAKEQRINPNYSIEPDTTTKLQSVTHERDLDDFLSTAQLAGTEFTAEKQNVKIISAPGVNVSSASNPFLLSAEDEKKTLQKHSDYKRSLRVPRRPGWVKSMTAVEVDKQEREAFLVWRRGLAQLQESEELIFTPFERNLEVWRQLWRVLERSHLVVQIIDARSPLRFRCEDLEDYVHDVEGPEGERGTGKGLRKTLLLVNKADLLTVEQRRQWADYFESNNVKYAFFSAANAKALQEARLVAEQAKARAEEQAARAGVEDEDEDEDDSDEETEDLKDVYDESEDEAIAPEDVSKVVRARKEHEDADTDPRTKVLSVLELEDLFVNSAPDLNLFAQNGVPPQKLVVGLVGYPNVGKSSTINALLGEKKVSVSSTPGKTKHFQTLHLSPTIMLCDCPGLVFPQFATSKADLVCDGVLPIDQLREYTAPVTLIVRRLPSEVLEGLYGLTIRRKTLDEGGDGKITAEDFLQAYAIARGYTRAGQGNPDEARAARYILKDYVDGRLLFCHPPPNVDANEFNALQQALTLSALQAAGKKKAPVTRVGKNADTYVSIAGKPTESQHVNEDGTTFTLPAQNIKSRQLDTDFFDEKGLSAKPYVQSSGAKGGQQFSRTVWYPHQRAIGDDGRPIEGGGVEMPAPIGAKASKKHYKGAKHVKQRSGRGYD